MKRYFKRQQLICSLAVIITIFMASSGFTHMPYWSEGNYIGPETAYVIEDIDNSLLVYNEVTCDSEQLWLTFDAQPGEELFVQTGVPLLDRFMDYYPTVVILAKGLPAPEQDFPFEVPEGLGAIVIETDKYSDSYKYFEEFSETWFLMLFEETYTLEQGGVGYVVTYHPERRTGKLFTATGRRESFDDEILAFYIASLPALLEFHEVDSEQTEAEAPAEYCGATDQGGEVGDGEISDAVDCSTMPTGRFRSLLTTVLQLLFSF